MAVWIPRMQRQIGYRGREKDIGESLKLSQLMVPRPFVTGRCTGGKIALCNLKLKV